MSTNLLLCPLARPYCHHVVITITVDWRNSHAYNSTWRRTQRNTCWATALSELDVSSYSQWVIGSGFELTWILSTKSSKAAHSFVSLARKRRLNQLLIYSEKRGNLLTSKDHFCPWNDKPHSNLSSDKRIEGHVGEYHPRAFGLSTTRHDMPTVTLSLLLSNRLRTTLSSD